MRKKLLIILLGLACVSMVGCGKEKETTTESDADGTKDIVIQEIVIQELYVDESIFREDIIEEDNIDERYYGKEYLEELEYNSRKSK